MRAHHWLAALGLVVLALTGGSPSAGAAADPGDPTLGSKIPTFEAEVIDASVDPVKVSTFKSAKRGRVTAYIFVGTSCGTTSAYADRFRDTVAAYAGRGVDFVFLYPNREDTRDGKINFQREKRLGRFLVDDKDGRLARQFGALRTTEVFLADKSGTVVYHGSLDDNRDATAAKQKHLANAIDAVLQGTPIGVGYSQVFG